MIVSFKSQGTANRLFHCSKAGRVSNFSRLDTLLGCSYTSMGVSGS